MANTLTVRGALEWVGSVFVIAVLVAVSASQFIA